MLNIKKNQRRKKKKKKKTYLREWRRRGVEERR